MAEHLQHMIHLFQLQIAFALFDFPDNGKGHTSPFREFLLGKTGVFSPAFYKFS